MLWLFMTDAKLEHEICEHKLIANPAFELLLRIVLWKNGLVTNNAGGEFAMYTTTRALW